MKIIKYCTHLGQLLCLSSLLLLSAATANKLTITSNSPHRLYQTQLELLLIDDEVASNQYVTTLTSSGASINNSAPPVIFGSRHKQQGNRFNAAWYPHAADNNVSTIFNLQPAQAFTGIADSQGNLGTTNTETFSLPHPGFNALVLSEVAFDTFKKMSLGSSQLLSVQEQLSNGSQRKIDAKIIKSAQLILKRPSALQCRDETIAGIAGKICLIRDIQGGYVTNNAGDIRFTVRSKLAATNAQFRVGSSWHHFGDSIPIAEFANSRGIEVFFVIPKDEEITSLKQQLDGKPLSALINVSFFSAARQSRGDTFSLSVGQSLLPGNQHSNVLSRLELLVIDDKAANNQYVTTATSSSSARGQPPLIYGTHHPLAGERNAIWYLRGITPLSTTQRPRSRIASQPTLSPAQAFSGFASQTGAPQQVADNGNPLLSEEGWRYLLNAPPGTSQQLRYEQKQTGQTNQIISHVIKQAQITLTRPSNIECRNETVEGLAGRTCLIRQVQTQGTIQASDLRFTLRTKLPAEQARYRVSNTWHRLGEVISVDSFNHSQGIEIFFVRPDPERIAALQTQFAHQNLASLVEASFFSASRQHQGDRFGLSLAGSRLPTDKSSLNVLSRLEVLVINDETVNNQFVTTVQSNSNQGQTAPLLYGSRSPTGSERAAIWYLFGESGKTPLSAPLTQQHTAPASLTPEQAFSGFADQQGRPQSGITGQNPVLSDAGWNYLLSAAPGAARLLRYQQQSGGQNQHILSHIIKQGQINLSRPANIECRDETINHQSGKVCLIRQVTVQGSLQSSSLRFELRSTQSTPNHVRYRVAQTWHALGESIPVTEFAHSNGIEIFWVPSAPLTSAATRTAAGAEFPRSVEALFYNSNRQNIGDRFALTIQSQELTPVPIDELTITELSSPVTEITAGETIEFTFSLNRTPYNGEMLLLKLELPQKAVTMIEHKATILNGQPIELPLDKWFKVPLYPQQLTYTLQIPTQNTLMEKMQVSLHLNTRSAHQPPSSPLTSLQTPLIGKSIKININPSKLSAQRTTRAYTINYIGGHIMEGHTSSVIVDLGKALDKDTNLSITARFINRTGKNTVSANKNDFDTDNFQVNGQHIPMLENTAQFVSLPAGTRYVPITALTRTHAAEGNDRIASAKTFAYQLELDGEISLSPDFFIISNIISVTNLQGPTSIISGNIASYTLTLDEYSQYLPTDQTRSVVLSLGQGFPSLVVLDGITLDKKQIKMDTLQTEYWYEVDKSKTKLTLEIPTMGWNGVLIGQPYMFLNAKRAVMDGGVSISIITYINENTGISSQVIPPTVKLEHPNIIVAGQTLRINFDAGKTYNTNMGFYMDTAPDSGTNIHKCLTPQSFRFNGNPASYINNFHSSFSLLKMQRTVSIVAPTLPSDMNRTEACRVKLRFGTELIGSANNTYRDVEVTIVPSFLYPEKISNEQIVSGKEIELTIDLNPDNGVIGTGEEVSRILLVSVNPTNNLKLNEATVDGQPVTLSEQPKAISIATGKKQVKIKIPTVEFYTGPNKLFTLTASGLDKDGKNVTQQGFGSLKPTHSTVTSIISEPIAAGEPAVAKIKLTNKNSTNTKLFLSLQPLGLLSADDIDWKKSTLAGEGWSINLTNFSHLPGTAFVLPGDANAKNELILTLPTKPFYDDDTRYFKLTANGGPLYDTTYAKELIQAIKGLGQKIEQIEGINGNAGGTIQYKLFLKRATLPIDEFFFKISLATGDGSGLLDTLDLRNAEIFSSEADKQPLDLSNPTGTLYKVTILNQKSLTIRIPVKVPNRFPVSEKTVTLRASYGPSFLENDHAIGTSKIEQISTELSIKPLSSTHISAELGTVDQLIPYEINWRITGLVFNTATDLRQMVLERRLKDMGSLRVKVNGPSVIDDPTACKLTITEGVLINNHIKLPAYLSYIAKGGQPVKKFHGCMDTPFDLTDANWLVKTDTTKFIQEGRLTLSLGFVMNDQYSQVTLENPRLTWRGKATATGEITVQPVWNNP